jgi:hypothetical protein
MADCVLPRPTQSPLVEGDLCILAQTTAHSLQKSETVGLCICTADQCGDRLERFRFKCSRLKMVQGGVFLRKMPLGIEDSVKTRIETGVDANVSNTTREL